MGYPGAPGLLSSPRSSLRSFRPVSRPSAPDSEYLASCSFPFALPRFASHSCSAGAHLSLSLRCSPLLPLPFVRFRFRLRLLSPPLFLSRFSLSCLAAASQVHPSPLSLPRPPLPFPLVSHGVLPVPQYSAFRLFPFVPPCFASHGCSTGARLPVSLRRFSLASAFFRPLPL